MPLPVPDGTLAEHRGLPHRAAAFDVSHLGTVRVTGPGALDRLQAALTNDLGKIAPGRAQYTHLLDAGDASVLDDIIVWWVDDERFDVMPNASNTDRVVGGRRRRRRHGRPGDHRRAGPGGPGAPGHRRPARPRRSAAARVAEVEVLGRTRAWSPAPATRARTASSWPCRRRTPPPCGTPWSAPASPRRAWAPATRCGSRPACRCTATSSAPASPRCRPGSAGSWPGTRATSGAARPLAAERERGVDAHAAGPRGRGPPPARGPTRPVLVDGEAVGRGHQRQLLADARPRHRPGLPAPGRRGGRRGGHRRPRHAGARPVVPTPFYQAAEQVRERRRVA